MWTGTRAVRERSWIGVGVGVGESMIADGSYCEGEGIVVACAIKVKVVGSRKWGGSHVEERLGARGGWQRERRERWE